MSDSGGRKAAGADQARRLTSSTEADWGGRSHGGPGHGVALPAAGGGWALDAGRRKAAPQACFPEKLCANAISKELANPSFSDGLLGGYVLRPHISLTSPPQALGQPPPEKPIYALSIAW